ncbi:hypothetical protein Veis_0363 [Verminephrobacter eiseniae EF01-2]|uniref:Uncharacterized protein n=1 Tax=Verminephrobacter eiseniae (strain EF01-2) TaxID=391735 RepID=A1WEU6_VEREI|nr:hypothetical protein Veis_0363 [Verminephrobacter eiseniae EF01-2]
MSSAASAPRKDEAGGIAPSMQRPWCRVTDHLSVCAGHRSASRRCLACQYSSVWAARCALRCAPMAARSLRHLIGDATLARAVPAAWVGDTQRHGKRR